MKDLELIKEQPFPIGEKYCSHLLQFKLLEVWGNLDRRSRNSLENIRRCLAASFDFLNENLSEEYEVEALTECVIEN